ncbi:hypothetical protein OPT61_g7159 [Boeremia exigua]|uniref:Uncharacterized protein n=1 Tax=Boeremia exigua TaxID=749465 RepID=A0ACC2I4F2_9PLEO|nr:hypothetical protein OPT61_g7159 [Boeremia exigua]
MAGRILPVALAAVSGIAIGMATFGEELKAQRMKRLTEEYNQEVAAAAAAATNNENSVAIAPTARNVAAPSAAQPSIAEEIEPATRSWSDTLGFWAWKKKPQQDGVPAALSAPAVAQEVPIQSTTKEQIKKP